MTTLDDFGTSRLGKSGRDPMASLAGHTDMTYDRRIKDNQVAKSIIKRDLRI